MTGKQIKKRGIDDILGKERATAVLNSLESTGRVTIRGISEADRRDLSNSLTERGYEVVTMAERMDDENPAYSLIVKKPYVKMIEKFESKGEFQRKH